ARAKGSGSWGYPAKPTTCRFSGNWPRCIPANRGATFAACPSKRPPKLVSLPRTEKPSNR
ncbi:MAG TPA: hypothetical protein VJU14_13375, partial [Solirubrobacterales bacterium]|nr:hypothetical protein [Solirubrobacterales bacterium]